MKRKHPTVYRQELHWVKEDRKILLASNETPFRVWTLMVGEQDPSVVPTLPFEPRHNANAFMEDRLHDWNTVYQDGKHTLLYYSRVVRDKVWVLVEYGEVTP